jgi:hypothetical protein
LNAKKQRKEWNPPTKKLKKIKEAQKPLNAVPNAVRRAEKTKFEKHS